ncbi:hypothetical protein GO001_15485 [Streptomyces sp. NRRL B-1677]|uniref:Secreted protein n=1 Tax=Streptomyces klenkii TaxID=1420899 RepID=A0A3B0BZA5_9ACTN|nr:MULTISPECIES: hypothetical protein [Streptomyces]MBF6046616.1 hypothetical protein [Streptomyces sp. NRRL B-1677]RKN77207.1 hypothetical protein D7231_00170 [Streptomyces klenkii]
MIGKRGVGIALSSLALVASGIGGAPAARARDHDHDRGHAFQDCTGRENITYGPGLSLSSGTSAVSVDGTYRCTDVPGRTITATYHTEGTTGGTCLLLASNKSEETLHYADGSTTVIAYRSGPSVRLAGVNTAVLDGVVVSGRGKGSAAEKTIQTLPAGLPTDCVLGGGIRHTVAFTHLSITR